MIFGKPVDLADFEQKEHHLSMDMSCIRNDKQEAREDIEKPGHFEVDKWIK